MNQPEQDKLFSLQTVLLVPIGIALNILLAQIVLWFELPLFLDSVGTILIAALGGILPGVMVGFFSNTINAIGDPITLYYGVISVLIALSSVFLARARMFTRFPRALVTAIPFACIGGLLGSLLTWALSGLTIGSGVSSPYALSLMEQYRLPPFFAQLAADFSIDLADKIITVILVYLIIKCIPPKCMSGFPNGEIYLSPGK